MTTIPTRLATLDGALRRKRALAAVCMAMLMSSLDTSIAHSALPALAQALAATFRQAQWIVVVYLLALTLLAPLAGRLGDSIGRRRVLLAGLVMFTLASALTAAAPTLGWLLAARAFQGAGAAVMMALAVAFVADLVPAMDRGRGMGLIGTMSAAGTTLGPALGGLLLATQGWRSIFMVNLPLGLAALWLAFRHLPADAVVPGVRANKHGLLALCRVPAVAVSLAMTALVSMVMMTTLVVGPFYLARSLQLGAGAVGLALAAGPLVAALSGIPAGMLVDRYGASRATSAALAAMAIACMMCAVLPAGLATYLGPVAVLTASYALFQAANGSALLGAVGPQRRGEGAGLLGMARNLGLIGGASVMAAVFAAGWANSGVIAASGDLVAGGMRNAFGLGGALMGGALMLSRLAASGTDAAKA